MQFVAPLLVKYRPLNLTGSPLKVKTDAYNLNLRDG